MDTHWIDRLSEYRDGELTAAERASCEAHLTECPRCREAIEDIEAVIHAARTERDSMPANDLWPAIHARIASGAADAAPHQEWNLASARRRPRHVTFTLPQLALAASLLIAVSAAVAYVAAGRMVGTPPLAYETPILAVAELAAAPATVDVSPANFADAQFDEAVADLERTLVEQRHQLDPRTIVVIERNLRTIDEAIRQAREALDADPANTFLNSHLAEARKRKIELLRRATSIAGD